jgi:predicted CxxxxCH...CXXCH cytochrome family protein
MRRLTSLSAAILLGWALTSCAADPPAASPDGGPVEDAATSDANGLDAARTDAGPGADGGGDVDAAIDPDAAVDVDAAVDPDAAVEVDAAVDVDAGDLVDAGGAIDAGTPATDAGPTVVDSGVVVPAGCILCHGDETSMAPPFNLDGLSETTLRGVGAHRSHLGASTWHNEVVCQDCHIVPATRSAVGHMDTALPAELTWSALATADSAAPAFDGVSCAGVYCHGPTLQPGGSNTTPTWTTVDGTQAACGTCHGLPPGGSHTTSTACSTCHPTMDASGAIIDPARHINGIVDVIGGALTCTSCHGDDLTGPAPPSDTSGGTATTLRGVGAHASHLATSTWRHEITCTECHVVPATIGAAGHTDSALPAELTWGPLATADTATPGFDGTTCSGTYCHGATLASGGTDTTPTWTRVDGSQDACGTCHGLPPGGTHPTATNCSMCHSTVINAAGVITAPALHVNGIVDRTDYHPAGWSAATSHGRTFNAGVPSACTSCHGATLTGGTVGVSCESCHPGWQTDCTFCHGNPVTGISSPPEGVNGQTSRLDITVGAHAEHVSATPLHIAWNCTFCHGPTTPTSVFSAGHLDGDSQAETVFGPILGAGTTYNATTGVCGNTYCHGTGSTRAAAPAWNTNPTLTCGSCHAPFTGATQAQLRAMGGEHDKHVRGEGFPCNRCHGTSVGATGAITNVAQHVNGVVEVSVPGFSATACGGTGGCSAPGAGCHGGDATIWCW